MAYGTREGIEIIFGTKNVAKWADANNDNDAGDIAARIGWALDEATDRINDRLRRGPYEIPFEAAPRRIVSLCNRLAGIILYETPRGLVDEGPQAAIAEMRDEIDNTLDAILRGREKLDASITSNDVPLAVPSTDWE